jgi:hypothetical protein
MPLNQIDVFNSLDKDFDKHSQGFHKTYNDVYEPVSTFPTSVNSKLAPLEEVQKHRPGPLDESPI